jgi:hypothetical protein
MTFLFLPMSTLVAPSTFINSALEPQLCKGNRPTNFREKSSLDSLGELVYGFAAGSTHWRCFSTAVIAEFSSEGMVKVESVKPPKAPADPASLHKKMMQLLSSLWVTHAIGTFARLGLADAMEAGSDNAEAIAKPLGLVTDRVYRLLRALSTSGIVTESAGGRFALTPLGRLLTSNAPNSMRT